MTSMQISTLEPTVVHVIEPKEGGKLFVEQEPDNIVDQDDNSLCINSDFTNDLGITHGDGSSQWHSESGHSFGPIVIEPKQLAPLGNEEGFQLLEGAQEGIEENSAIIIEDSDEDEPHNAGEHTPLGKPAQYLTDTRTPYGEVLAANSTPSEKPIGENVFCRHIDKGGKVGAYVCSLCSFASHNSTAVTEHTSWHKRHGQEQTLIFNDTSKVRGKILKDLTFSYKDGVYICDTCKVSTNNRGMFRTHILYHAKSLVGRCAYCNYCELDATQIAAHCEKEHPGLPVKSSYSVDMLPSDTADLIMDQLVSGRPTSRASLKDGLQTLEKRGMLKKNRMPKEPLPGKKGTQACSKKGCDLVTQTSFVQADIYGQNLGMQQKITIVPNFGGKQRFVPRSAPTLIPLGGVSTLATKPTMTAVPVSSGLNSLYAEGIIPSMAQSAISQTVRNPSLYTESIVPNQAFTPKVGSTMNLINKGESFILSHEGKALATVPMAQTSTNSQGAKVVKLPQKLVIHNKTTGTKSILIAVPGPAKPDDSATTKSGSSMEEKFILKAGTLDLVEKALQAAQITTLLRPSEKNNATQGSETSVVSCGASNIETTSAPQNVSANTSKDALTDTVTESSVSESTSKSTNVSHSLNVSSGTTKQPVVNITHVFNSGAEKLEKHNKDDGSSSSNVKQNATAVVRCRYDVEQGSYICLRCNYQCIDLQAFRRHLWKEIHRCTKHQCYHCPDHVTFNKFHHCPVLNQLIKLVKKGKSMPDQLSASVETEHEHHQDQSGSHVQNKQGEHSAECQDEDYHVDASSVEKEHTDSHCYSTDKQLESSVENTSDIQKAPNTVRKGVSESNIADTSSPKNRDGEMEYDAGNANPVEGSGSGTSETEIAPDSTNPKVDDMAQYGPEPTGADRDSDDSAHGNDLEIDLGEGDDAEDLTVEPRGNSTLKIHSLSAVDGDSLGSNVNVDELNEDKGYESPLGTVDPKNKEEIRQDKGNPGSKVDASEAVHVRTDDCDQEEGHHADGTQCPAELGNSTQESSLEKSGKEGTDSTSNKNHSAEEPDDELSELLRMAEKIIQDNAPILKEGNVLSLPEKPKELQTKKTNEAQAPKEFQPEQPEENSNFQQSTVDKLRMKIQGRLSSEQLAANNASVTKPDHPQELPEGSNIDLGAEIGVQQPSEEDQMRPVAVNGACTSSDLQQHHTSLENLAPKGAPLLTTVIETSSSVVTEKSPATTLDQVPATDDLPAPTAPAQPTTTDGIIPSKETTLEDEPDSTDHAGAKLVPKVAIQKAADGSMKVSIVKPSATHTSEEASMQDETSFLAKKQGFFACNFANCEYSTDEAERFDLHNSMFHGLEQCFTCKYCSHISSNKTSLREHYISHKQQFQLFRCGVESCNFGTVIAANFSDHYVKEHLSTTSKRTKITKFKCFYCHENMYSVDRLIHHLQDNFVRLLQCPYCPVTSQNHSTIVSHLAKSHQAEKRKVVRVFCLRCIKTPTRGENKNVSLSASKKLFQLSQNVPSSPEVVHSQGTWMTTLNVPMPLTPTTPDSPSKHKPSILKRPSTPITGESPLPSAYNIMTTNSTQEGQSIAREYVCGACSLCFHSLDHFYKHMKNCDSQQRIANLESAVTIKLGGRKSRPEERQWSGPEIQEESESGEEQASEEHMEPFKCEKCCFMSFEAGVVDVHMMQHDVPQAYKMNFICMKCPYATDESKDYIEHMHHHPGEHSVRIYQCIHCNLQTAMLSCMESHLTYAHSESEFRFEVNQIKVCGGTEELLKLECKKQDNALKRECKKKDNTIKDYQLSKKTPDCGTTIKTKSGQSSKKTVDEKTIGYDQKKLDADLGKVVNVLPCPPKRLKKFQCEYCDSEFPTTYKYAMHLKKQHVGVGQLQVPLYKCAFCIWKASSERFILEHIHQMHRNHLHNNQKVGKSGRPIMAGFIEVGSTEGKVWFEDRPQNVMTLKLVPNQTGPISKTEDPVVQIERYHCDHCDYSTNDIEEFRTHEASHCGISSDSDITRPDNQTVAEVHNGENGDEWTDYVAISEGEDTELSAKEKKNGKAAAPGKTETFNCTHCAYTTNKFYNLQKHMKRHQEVATSGSGFRCTYCSYETTQKWIVSRHIHLYHENRPVKILDIAKNKIISSSDSAKPKSSKSKSFRTKLAKSALQKARIAQSRLVTGSQENTVSTLPVGLSSVNIGGIGIALPTDMIFRTPQKCPFCEHQTKVRYNFIRHLKAHERDGTAKAPELVLVNTDDDGQNLQDGAVDDINPSKKEAEIENMNPILSSLVSTDKDRATEIDQPASAGPGKETKTPEKTSAGTSGPISLGDVATVSFKEVSQPMAEPSGDKPVSGPDGQPSHTKPDQALSENKTTVKISDAFGEESEDSCVFQATQKEANENQEQDADDEDEEEDEEDNDGDWDSGSEDEAGEEYVPPATKPKITSKEQNKYSKRVPGMNLFQCKSCIFMARYRSKVRRHYYYKHASYHPYRCGYCDFNAVESAKVRRHCTIVHKGKPVKVVDVEVDGVSSSSNADASAKQGSVASNGQPGEEMSTSAFADDEDVVNQCVRKDGMYYWCKYCGYHQEWLSNLKRHVYAVHLRFYPFRCPYCAFAMVEANKVQKHVMNVHPEKPLKIRRKRYNKPLPPFTSDNTDVQSADEVRQSSTPQETECTESTPAGIPEEELLMEGDDYDDDNSDNDEVPYDDGGGTSDHVLDDYFEESEQNNSIPTLTESVGDTILQNPNTENGDLHKKDKDNWETLKKYTHIRIKEEPPSPPPVPSMQEVDTSVPATSQGGQDNLASPAIPARGSTEHSSPQASHVGRDNIFNILENIKVEKVDLGDLNVDLASQNSQLLSGWYSGPFASLSPEKRSPARSQGSSAHSTPQRHLRGGQSPGSFPLDSPKNRSLWDSPALTTSQRSPVRMATTPVTPPKPAASVVGLPQDHQAGNLGTSPAKSQMGSTTVSPEKSPCSAFRGKILKCAHCDYMSRWGQMDVRRHILSVHICKKPYECEYCDFGSHKANAVVDHIKHKHKGQSTKHVVQQRERLFVYTEAVESGPGFVSYGMTKAGESVKAAALSNPRKQLPVSKVETRPVEPAETEPLQKPKLTVSLKTLTALKTKVHVAASTKRVGAHVKKGRKPIPPKQYKCIMCGWKSKDKKAFQNHLMTEIDYKPYQCLRCTNRQVRIDNMVTHCMRFHKNQSCFTKELDGLKEIQVEELLKASEVGAFVKPETPAPDPVWIENEKSPGNATEMAQQTFPIKRTMAVASSVEPLPKKPKVELESSAQENSSYEQPSVSPRTYKEAAVTSTASSSKQKGESPKVPTMPAVDPDAHKYIFICIFCNYTTKAYTNMFTHMMREVDYRPYKCAYCPVTGVFPSDLKRHCASQHAGLPPRQENVPNPKLRAKMHVLVKQSRQLRPEYDTNSKIMTGETPEEQIQQSLPETDHLPGSSQDFSEKEEAADGVEEVDHSNDSEKESPSVSNRLELRKKQKGFRMRRRVNAGNYKCVKCGYKSYSKSGMQRHLMRELNYKPFVCDICSRVSVAKGELWRDCKKSHPGIEQCSYRKDQEKHSQLKELMRKSWKPKHARLKVNLNPGQSQPEETKVGSSIEEPKVQKVDPSALPVRAGYLTCILCGNNQYREKKNLYRHIMKEMGYCPYKCGYCTWKGIYPANVRGHILTEHGPGTAIKIERIDHKLKTEVFEVYKKSCELSKNPLKRTCSRPEGNIKTEDATPGIKLQARYAESSKNVTFRCTQCGFTHAKRKNMECHIVRHTPPRVQCNVCGHQDWFKSKMVEHLFKLHPGQEAQSYRLLDIPEGQGIKDVKHLLIEEIPVTKEVQKKLTGSKSNQQRAAGMKSTAISTWDDDGKMKKASPGVLPRYKKISNGFACLYCSWTTTVKASVYEHITRVHSPYRWRCSNCDFTCHHGSEMKKHYKSMSHRDMELRMLNIDSGEEHIHRDNSWVAVSAIQGDVDLPDDRSSVISEVQSDITSISRCTTPTQIPGQKSTQGVIYCCHWCRYKTRSEDNFAGHVGRHLTEMSSHVSKNIPHRCGYCNFTTTSHQEFNRHVQSHTIEKPYQCGHCGNMYFQKHKVKQHSRRVHLGLPLSILETIQPYSEEGVFKVVNFQPQVVLRDCSVYSQ